MEQAARAESERRENELAANVRAADLTQLLARLDADMTILASREASSSSQAEETAKDMKYLFERQMKLASIKQILHSRCPAKPSAHDIGFRAH